MRIPISWLREYVDLPAESQAIADRLAMLGFPVDQIVRRPTIANVLVGRIVALERHPNADRLQVCNVDVGADRALTIVTAATNVAAQQVIPVATVGARLPHLEIERRTMRGIESEGMLCSPDELALPPEWFEADGIMQLDDALPIGGDAVALLGLRDDILDVEITANRVDVMCAIGLARELAASYRVRLRLPPFENPGKGAAQPAPRVEIESADCVQFVLQRFDGVRVRPAPATTRVRLALCGVRPINNLVDISNYVMLETGEPMHFYDAARVADQRLIVRNAKAGEKLTTLDGVERTLSPEALVIADAGGPLGLAGVMGGASSEVTDATSAILLEAASFNGARVRRTAKLFGLRTEASARHEKSPAPVLAEIAAARAAQLVTASGGHAYAPAITGAPLASPRPIALRVYDVERLLGLRLTAERIMEHLVALGCGVERRKEVCEVTVPPWRNDLEIAADLVEEIARMEGYDAIEAALPATAPHEISSREYHLERDAARAMLALGYHEIVTHSLRADGDEHAVELRNPLSEDQRYLRTDAAPALLSHLARLGRAYRLFEIGHVFAREGGVVAELPMLTLAYAAERGEEPAWRDTEFLRLRGDCEALLRVLTGKGSGIEAVRRAPLHPGKSAALTIDGVHVAVLGRVDPREERSYGSSLPLYLAEVRLDRLPERSAPRYRPPSRFPSTYRDLALSVDVEVSAEAVEGVTAQAIGDTCTAVRVFDEYRGPQVEGGRKSLAVRATMQRFDGTITDEEADAAVARAVEALHERLGAMVRV
ncbi:MAG TPA: phenylalanine--tRNA ligase subunit beta [Candidatus Tyrphobacter sp.]